MNATWTLKPDPNMETNTTEDEAGTLKTFLVIMGVVGFASITIGCYLMLMKREVWCCKKKRSPLRRTPVQRPSERPTEGDRYSAVNTESAELLGSNTQTGRDGSISISMDQRDRVLSRLEGRGYLNTARVLREIFDMQDVSSDSSSDAGNTQHDLQMDQLPPTYEELLDQNDRQMNRIESNTERVLREIYSRPTWLDTYESNHDLNEIEINAPQYTIRAFDPRHLESRRNITDLRNDVQHTEANPEMEQTETGPGTEQTHQTWASYFNTANRLRDLINGTITTRNIANEVDHTSHISLSGESTVVNINADISEQCCSRPRTPPPAYHDLENSEPLLPRTNSLPSYDDFIMMPYKYTS